MIKKIPRWILFGSVILAFSAGYLNCVALLGFGNNAVSHVTGTVTIAADSVAHRDLAGLQRTGFIVISFFAGAIVSGIIVRNEALRMGRRYGVALGLESVLLFAAAALFYRHSYLGELIASAACGLQNAMVATYSGSVIRTTHLTGIVSDIGAAIGNRLAGGFLNRAQVRLQTAIFAGFFAGAVLGSLVFLQYSYLSLLVPATIVLIAGITYIVFSSRFLGKN